MRPRASMSLLGLVTVCLACSACGRATYPLAATQTIRGVSVAVESTITQASETPYSLSAFLVSAKPGYRLASVMGTATNSTNATVAVPGAYPETILDSNGAVLQGWGSMRVVLDASGRWVMSRLVGHKVLAAEGMGPGGKTFCIVSYMRPVSSRGPVTAVWKLGGGRTYRFTLRSP